MGGMEGPGEMEEEKLQQRDNTSAIFKRKGKERTN